MTEEIIVVAKREKVGKNATRDLRNANLIPAVIYGLNEPTVPVAISPKVVARIIASESGMNSLINMQREGTDIQRHVIIKDVQRHPVTGRLSHIDFLRVDPTHKVRVKAPLVLKGNSIGVKEGGILDFIHREVEVECLPAFIPGHIDINISGMRIGDTLRVDQVTFDSHLTIIGDTHNVICTIAGKPVEEVAEAVEAPAAPAKKGKK
ncbi:MAG: ribosomal protein L25p [Holophagaceae bacterium]|nr:ribosomal protein L25p [Holophagaceae bacterium]